LLQFEAYNSLLQNKYFFPKIDLIIDQVSPQNASAFTSDLNAIDSLRKYLTDYSDNFERNKVLSPPHFRAMASLQVNWINLI